MKRFSAYLLIFLALALCSHDMYLKLDSYFLEPESQATLSLYNGTFDKSEAILTRERMRDASMVGHGERKAIAKDSWNYRDSTLTQLSFTTGKEGTYMLGVSRETSTLEMEAERFNNYLKHDGVLGMLEQRRQNNTLDQDSKERYAKHGKTIFQVGDRRTNDYKAVLGYPIEFLPLENPYDKHTGDSLRVQLLLEGEPLAEQFVQADHRASGHHSHGDSTHTHHDGKVDDHTHEGGQRLKTDANGEVSIELAADGIYYLRTIHMQTMEGDPDLTHESKWATLTFEVTHEHGDDTHTHVNSGHEHDESIPSWIFIVGSLVVIGLLFLVFRKQS